MIYNVNIPMGREGYDPATEAGSITCEIYEKQIVMEGGKEGENPSVSLLGLIAELTELNIIEPNQDIERISIAASDYTQMILGMIGEIDESELTEKNLGKVQLITNIIAYNATVAELDRIDIADIQQFDSEDNLSRVISKLNEKFNEEAGPGQEPQSKLYGYYRKALLTMVNEYYIHTHLKDTKFDPELIIEKSGGSADDQSGSIKIRLPEYSGNLESHKDFLEVVGITLNSTLEERVTELRSIFEQLQTQITNYHEKGLIHADIKPGNICFDELGYVALCDHETLTTELTSCLENPVTMNYLSLVDVINIVNADSSDGKCAEAQFENKKQAEYESLRRTSLLMLIRTLIPLSQNKNDATEINIGDLIKKRSGFQELYNFLSENDDSNQIPKVRTLLESADLLELCNSSSDFLGLLMYKRVDEKLFPLISRFLDHLLIPEDDLPSEDCPVKIVYITTDKSDEDENVA